MEWGHQEGKSPPQPAAWCPPSLALPLVPGNGCLRQNIVQSLFFGSFI